MDYQLQTQCQQVIYAASYDTWDYKTGEIRHGDPSSYYARIIGKMKRVTGRDGIEVVSSKQLVMNSSMVDDCSQVFWLPEDDQTDWNQAKKPIAVSNRVDENGNFDYCMIFL